MPIPDGMRYKAGVTPCPNSIASHGTYTNSGNRQFGDNQPNCKTLECRRKSRKRHDIRRMCKLHSQSRGGMETSGDVGEQIYPLSHYGTILRKRSHQNHLNVKINKRPVKKSKKILVINFNGPKYNLLETHSPNPIPYSVNIQIINNIKCMFILTTPHKDVTFTRKTKAKQLAT